ncbi:hypothetical protein [Polyangium aurulentum]|uniref:hypothetical protein n=1 Tax=Polyangium aurulentum TaxID=2567896 RepID=UPI0010AE2A08|nr:hypothetical protein [Polyangium aurulentum]UQA57645.1 hypothetical protein E8A73_041255 [Polyangium aurulentum]
MKRICSFLALAALSSGCALPKATPAPPFAPVSLGPSVASCPVTPPRRVPVEVRDVAWSGLAGDRTWALATQGHKRVLVRLVGGRLESVPLPDEYQGAAVAVHARANLLWVMRSNASLPSEDPAWMFLDVASSERPQPGPFASLEPLPPEGPSAFAVAGDRALFFLSEKRSLLPWDLGAAQALGARVRSDGAPSDRPALHCEAKGCFAVAAEGDGPNRRMIVRRFDRQGREEHEELGPEPVAEWTTAETGAGTLVAWSAFGVKGMRACMLDASGKPTGPAYALGGVEADLQDPKAFPTHEGVLLAWQAARVGWRIGGLREDGRAVERVTTVPVGGSALTVAAVEEGVVAAVYTTGTDDEGGKQEWFTTAEAAFVSPGDTASAEPAEVLLDDARGPGRGGYSAHAMAAPGWGAVLVAPEGDAKGKSFLSILREPCSK